ncbi:MAG: hypothetical protein IPK59_23290 [Rhodospirillaceae bacterium]|nr:hypothetical protein [Rhodospirillaceae bacterium]
MSAGWNRCGQMSEKPALEMTRDEARREVLKLRLRVIVLHREIDRGRPLTAAEQVANLEAGLGLEPGRLASLFR